MKAHYTQIFTAAFSALTLASASAASITIQNFDYFSTAEDFSDGNISVVDGNAKWQGVTDSTGATTHTGTFGDGTVLDYQFIGTNRGAGTLQVKASGSGTYIAGNPTVGTYGSSGGGNSGLSVWTTTNPDDTGTFDTTPDSSTWGQDHVTGGDQLRGSIDISGLATAQLYFIYGSYKNSATIGLSTTAGGSELGTLSLPGDGADNGRLVIQEVTIDNADGTYGVIHFNYSAQASAGRGRFSGLVLDGTVVPEPSSFLMLGCSGLLLLIRRRR